MVWFFKTECFYFSVIFLSHQHDMKTWNRVMSGCSICGKHWPTLPMVTSHNNCCLNHIICLRKKKQLLFFPVLSEDRSRFLRFVTGRSRLPAPIYILSDKQGWAQPAPFLEKKNLKCVIEWVFFIFLYLALKRQMHFHSRPHVLAHFIYPTIQGTVQYCPAAICMKLFWGIIAYLFPLFWSCLFCVPPAVQRYVRRSCATLRTTVWPLIQTWAPGKSDLSAAATLKELQLLQITDEWRILAMIVTISAN